MERKLEFPSTPCFCNISEHLHTRILILNMYIANVQVNELWTLANDKFILFGQARRILF